MPSTVKADPATAPTDGDPADADPADGRADDSLPVTGESHRMPGVLDSARTARRAVEHFLTRLGRTELVEAATLVVSELVTNAVLHGRPPLHLDLNWTTDDRPALRLDVHDHGRIALHAVEHHADEDAESGRGLLVVDHLAARWGLSPHHVHGTHAWAEIATA